MKFIKGKTYKWNEILEGSDSVDRPVRYLLHKRGTDTIAAACLDILINPRAPYELTPANGPQIKPCADKFCNQGTPVPVFVRELDRKWYYRGQFKVVGESSDENELTLRGRQAGRTDIYKIIHLAEVGL
jgi:hypothetical protein